MPAEFSDILEELAKDVSKDAKVALAKAREILASLGPLALQWESEAREAEAKGDTDRAASKRGSIGHIKHAIVLEAAAASIESLDKVERAILKAFDRALAMLP